MVNNLDNQVLDSSLLSKLMKKLEDIILALKMEADNGKLWIILCPVTKCK